MFGELEMLQMLGQFFDKAMYWAAIGYEREAHTSPKRAGAGHAKEQEIGHVVGR